MRFISQSLSSLNRGCQDTAMDCGIAHHTASADIVWPCLELRFDEDNQLTTRGQPAANNWQYQRHRYERNIYHHQPDGFRKPLDITSIGTLYDDNALILAERPGKLAVANINSVHSGRAGLQKAVSETARRGPYIGADPACRVNLEPMNRGCQLITSPADEARTLPHGDFRIRFDARPRFEMSLIIHRHYSGHDQAASRFA